MIKYSSAVNPPRLTKIANTHSSAVNRGVLTTRICNAINPPWLTEGMGAFILTLILLISIGCQGPAGPAGLDAEGVDVIPPTIELVKPYPLSEVWDEITVAATAVDNVAINEVIFTFDGSSMVRGQFLRSDKPPYEFTIEAIDRDSVRYFEPGWHFIAARAYDTAGNYTDSPIVPIKLGFSDDLQDTVLLKHHNNVPYCNWTLPDTAGATAYWARFNAVKNCDLISIEVMLGGSISDSADCTIEIWDGNIFPETMKMDTIVSPDWLSGDPDWLRIDLVDREIRVEDDYFVIVRLETTNETDSLTLMADDGLPPYRRSGSLDDDGLHTLVEKYGVQYNLMINSMLYYGVVDEDDDEPPPSGLSPRWSDR
ncbi:MAG: Ig-like domain-containing protein [Candidatus Hatepunaea meridiana]|nr:Ig-like domain-containing protein [Candidatus Hatepunaea meridiana]